MFFFQCTSQKFNSLYRMCVPSSEESDEICSVLYSLHHLLPSDATATAKIQLQHPEEKQHSCIHSQDSKQFQQQKQ